MALKLKDLQISSDTFTDMGDMPEKCTGLGEDVSPHLEWSGVPERTRSLAIICHDPDAPLPDGYTHWVITGIPPEATGIREGGGGAYIEGINGWGTVGYRGPMPPTGHGDHRYYFWLFALDEEVTESLNRREFIDRYGSHVIEQARVVGVFRR